MSGSIYVDDIAFGADSDTHAYQLYSDSKAMLQQGGFNLRKFVTSFNGELRKMKTCWRSVNNPVLEGMSLTRDPPLGPLNQSALEKQRSWE